MATNRYPPSLRRALYRLGLEQNIVPPAGVYTRPAMRVAPFYEQFGVQFVWDLPYSVLAVAQVGGRVDLARGFVQNMLDLAITDGPDAGMVPRSVTVDGGQAGQDGSQTPLLAWLSLQLHRQEPDVDFVRSVYPALGAFVDWWQSPRRDVDGDGLSEFGGSSPTYVAYESGHDFSPERDLVMGEPTEPSDDGIVHEPIADVFLNACLYAEIDALAAMAHDLGDARAGEWEARRDALAARMHEAMWDDEVGGFFPVVRRDLCVSQPRFFRHTPALLQPLWAGLATQAQADRTIATLRQTPRDYPHHDAMMRIVLDGSLLHGYQVVTDGLHPTRGNGGAAGGVELVDGGFIVRFGKDRGPAVAAFHPVMVDVTVRSAEPGGGHVTVLVEDGHGRVVTAVDEDVKGDCVIESGGIDPFDASDQTWTDGLRRIELRATRCEIADVTLRHRRMDRAGLLSAYGIKSAHPLDGKHPAPGAPTQFWSGTIWGPHQLHGCHALRRYGHDDLARACARAFCDAVATSFAAGGEAFEHISHEDGRGLGITDYTWTAAVALVLMQDFIDDDMPEEDLA
jgi:hypothetical protein